MSQSAPRLLFEQMIAVLQKLTIALELEQQVLQQGNLRWQVLQKHLLTRQQLIKELSSFEQQRLVNLTKQKIDNTISAVNRFYQQNNLIDQWYKIQQLSTTCQNYHYHLVGFYQELQHSFNQQACLKEYQNQTHFYNQLGQRY